VYILNKKNHKNKSMKYVFAGVIILAIIGGVLFFKSPGIGQKSNAVETQSVRIERGNIEDVVTSQGKLEPKEYVDVGAQVSGQLKKLAVELGDNVSAGDLIAEIDAEIYETQVQGEEANLKTLNAQKTEQEAKVLQARQKVNRSKKLYEAHALSQEVFQDYQTDLKVAQAQLGSINAQIERAEYSLKGNKTNLNYTKIYAPMAGTVVSQSAREGQTLNANQTTPTIVQLADLSTMTVKAQVAEADIVKIKPGMDVYFTILGSQDRKWDAKVRQVLPTPEIINDVVLYNVMVDVDNKDQKLMSGMSTQMFFVVGKADNVLTIPLSYLTQREPGRENTYKVEVLHNGKKEMRSVVTGTQDRVQAEIISGLEEGDQVIESAAPSGPRASAGGGRAMRGMARL
jgi:macrolide-specific efflux system membrane fusion protein